MDQRQINRNLTHGFIMRLPVDVVLVPRTKVQKPSGGFVWEDQAPRDVQTVTLIEQTGLSGQPTPRMTSEGKEREVEFTLVAEWDALIERFDSFSYQGKECEIVDLFFDNGYEKRALVVSRG